MSYRDNLNRLKNFLKPEGEGPSKPTEGAFEGSEGAQLEEYGKNSVYPWRLLYPSIDVREWEIIEDHRGVFGRKVRGGDSGLIAFYIPRGWKPTTKGRKEDD